MASFNESTVVLSQSKNQKQRENDLPACTRYPIPLPLEVGETVPEPVDTDFCSCQLAFWNVAHRKSFTRAQVQKCDPWVREEIRGYRCAGTLACMVAKTPTPTPPAAPLPYIRTPEDILGSTRVLTPCVVDETGDCISPFDCSNPLCCYKETSPAHKAMVKESVARRKANWAENQRRRNFNRKVKARKARIRYARESFAEEAARIAAVKAYFAALEPYQSVGPKGGMPTSTRQVKRRTLAHAFERAPVYGPTTAPLSEPPIQPRSVMLLTKLRALIAQCREYTYDLSAYIRRISRVSPSLGMRCPVEAAEEAFEEIELQPIRPYYNAQPSTSNIEFKTEMMDPNIGDDNGPSINEASNVIIQDAVPENVDVIGPALNNLRRFCETDITSYDRDLDRWIDIGSFIWSTNNASGVNLFNQFLPLYGLIQNGAWLNNVAANVVKMRQYLYCDLEVKVEINSSVFNVGQLQVTFFYRADLDDKFTVRDNVYSVSQNNHVLLDASSSESAVLKVPFKSYKNFMATRQTDEADFPLIMGSLYIKVLNKLKVPTSSSTEIDGQVFMKLTNARLMGMIPPELSAYTGEMLSMMAATTALEYVRQKLADRNRDNPSDPRSYNHLVPTATNNLAAGTNIVEPLSSLRLDAAGATPHPDFIEDEMSISFVTRKFGLIKTIELSSRHTNGTLLACFNCAPMSELAFYNKTYIDGNTVYYLPPVAVASSLFGYWRGDMELRLDFIATAYHQCRLFICWVPNYQGSLTLKQAANLGGVYFDLKEGNRSITVKVPYISDTPWWPHAYSSGVGGDIQGPPSKICVYVVNRLMYTNAVTPNIDINLYMRGGENFELAVPIQPTIGLSFNARTKKPHDEITYAKPGYYPWYVGTWNSIYGGKVGVLRYGPVTQHIAQFDSNDQDCTYYKFQDRMLSASLKYYPDYKRGEVATGDDSWFVPISAEDGDGFIYMGVCSSLERVINYYYVKDSRGIWTKREVPDNSQLTNISDTTNSTYYFGTSNAILVGTKVPIPPQPKNVDLPKVQGNNDDTNNTIVFEGHQTERVGALTFGEKCVDFKDLGRRYMPYCHLNLKNAETKLGGAMYSIPILPQGLALLPEFYDESNYLRDGQIPILLSGYRFYRGGLRFKIIAPIDTVSNFHVQHKPDRVIIDDHVHTKLTKYDKLYNYGYATSFQVPFVNPVDTVEIPFYLPGAFGLLQRPKTSVNRQARRHMSMGALHVGATRLYKQEAEKDIDIVVLYKFADDFRAYTFQGFPPMLFITEAGSDTDTVQSHLLEPPKRPFYVPTPSESMSVISETEIYKTEMNVPEYTTELGPYEYIKKKFDKMSTRTTNAVVDRIMHKTIEDFDVLLSEENANKIANVLSRTIENVPQEKIKEITTTVIKTLLNEEVLDKIVKRKISINTFGRDFILGFSLSLIEGEYKYLGAVLFHSIAEILGLNQFVACGIIVAFARVCEAVSNQRHTTLRTEASEFEIDDGVAILTAIWQAIAVSLDVRGAQPKNIRSLAKSLFNSINFQARGSRGLITFIKNIIVAIKSLFSYAYTKILALKPIHSVVHNEVNIMNKWTIEALEITSPLFRQDIMTDKNKFIRLDVCFSVGKFLYNAVMEQKSLSNSNYFVQLYKKLENLYGEAVNEGIGSQIRQEPVCVWLTGEPGMGKTHIMSHLITKLMQQFGQNSQPTNIYTYSPGVTHWDGCRGKGVMRLDDFGVVNGQSLEKEVSVIHQLVSSARFSPEFAHLENKGASFAPYLVIIGSNASHPQNNEIADKMAFHRRRDFVISFKFTKEFLDKGFINMKSKGAIEWVNSQVTPENKYPHLAFSFLDPMAGNTVFEHAKDMAYPTFLTTLLEEAMLIYNQKRITFLQAMRALDHQPEIKGPLEDVLEKIITSSVSRSTFVIKDPETLKERLYKAYGFAKENVVNFPESIRSMFKTDVVGEMGNPNPFASDTEEEKTNDIDVELREMPHGSSEMSELKSMMRLMMTRQRLLENQLSLGQQFYNLRVDDRFKRAAEYRKAGKKYCKHNLVWVEKLSSIDEVDSINFKVVCDCLGECNLLKESFYVDMINALGKEHPCIEILMKYAYENKIFSSYWKHLEFSKKCLKDVSELFELLRSQVTVSKRTKWILASIGGLTMLTGALVFMDKVCKFGFVFDKTVKHNAKEFKPPLERTSLLAKNFNNRGVVENNPYGKSDPKQPKNRQAVVVKTLSGELVEGRIVRKVISNSDEPSQNSVDYEDVAYESEALRVIENLVDVNMCYLIVSGVHKNSEKPVNNFQMRCFGIVNNWLLLLNHYRMFMLDLKIEKIAFVNHSATIIQPLDFNKLTFSVYRDSELCLIKLPPQIPRFRDIRKHIISQDSTRYAPTQFEIFEKSIGTNMRCFMVQGRIETEVKYSCDDIVFKIPQAIMYNWQDPGRCMSVVVVKTKADYKIIGFHIAGGQGTGVAEPVVRETFDGLGDGLVMTTLDGEMFKEDGNPAITLNTHIQPVGVVKDQLAHRPAEKSMIRPSLIHGYLPVRTAPNPLTIRDTNGKFSPLVTGVDRHGKPPLGFETHLLKRAQQELLEHTLLHTRPQRQNIGLLTVSEAVCGIEGMDGYESMELSTSEGFPYYATRPSGARNKRYQFEFEETESGRICRINDPVLLEKLERNTKLRSQGKVPITVFVDCLKDYRNPIAKNSKPGCTRIFSISPTDFTIQFRQYFMDFLAATKVCRFDNEHMVGINVNGLEWTKLARVLQTKGPKLLCGDYSGFGPSLDPEVVLAVGEVWIRWYEVKGNATESESLARRCFIEELRHSFHLVKNLIYQTWCGSPSGAPCTVNINSDVGRMYIYMAWLDCWKSEPMMCNFVAMRKHIVLFTYGDDLIINVSDFAAEHFNNEFLQKFFFRHGLKYTDETKGDTIRKWTDITEASFLKNKFIRHPHRHGIFTAGLCKQSIEECANWVQYSTDLEGASKQTSCDAVMLAYGWGPEYFDWFRNQILEAWSQVPQQTPLTLYTYAEMDWMRFGYSNDSFMDDDQLLRLIEKEQQWRERNKELISLADSVAPIQFY